MPVVRCRCGSSAVWWPIVVVVVVATVEHLCRAIKIEYISESLKEKKKDEDAAASLQCCHCQCCIGRGALFVPKASCRRRSLRCH
jgi:hypothetical protein